LAAKMLMTFGRIFKGRSLPFNCRGRHFLEKRGKFKT
jgi:hypothetical protein